MERYFSFFLKSFRMFIEHSKVTFPRCSQNDKMERSCSWNVPIERFLTLGSENIQNSPQEQNVLRTYVFVLFWVLRNAGITSAQTQPPFTYHRRNERRRAWPRAGVSLVSARGGGAQLKPLEAHHNTVFHSRSAPHRTLPVCGQRCFSIRISPDSSSSPIPVGVGFEEFSQGSDTHVTTTTVCEFTPAKAPWKWRDRTKRFRCGDNFEEVRVFWTSSWRLL